MSVIDDELSEVKSSISTDKTPTTPAGLRRLLSKALVYPLAIYALSRVLVFTAIGAGALLSDQRSFRQAALAWDNGFYTEIAMHGYNAHVGDSPLWHHIAFFPGFPLIIRALTEISPLTPTEAGFFASFVGGAAAVVLIWKITEMIFDRTVAERAAVLFSFFPGAYVISLIYSEAVMIPLAMLCLYALMKRQWLLAGCAAAIATGVRSNALPLVACCAYEAFMAIRLRKEWRSLIAPMLAPIGFISYLLYVQIHTGTFSTWLNVQREQWDQQTDPLAAARVVHRLIRASGQDINLVVVTGGLIVVGLIAFLAWVKRVHLPALLYIYTTLSVAMVLVSPALMPKPRFILTAFPLLIIVAKVTSPRMFAPLVGTSAAILAILATVSMAGIYITP